MLSDVWDSLKGKQRAQLVLQVVDFEKTLAATKFNGFGSLYYKDDLHSSVDTLSLYVDNSGNEVQSTKFAIGPTNHRTFFDFGRGSLDIDRGPCKCLYSFREHVISANYICAQGPQL